MIAQLSRMTPPHLIARNVLVNVLKVLSTPHHPDRYLELADPVLATASLRGRITYVDRTVDGSVTLAVALPRPIDVAAGRHVRLAVTIDGVRHVRAYSPAVQPNSRGRVLVFTVGVHPGGLVSGHLHSHARVGDIVELDGVGGDFVLPSPPPGRLLFLSGGSGITPVLAMATALADCGHTGAVTFVHYARTAAHVPRRAELDALAARPNVEVVLAYTRESGGHLCGRFERGHLEAVAPWFARTDTYACGPGGMIEQVHALYAQVGASDLLRTESFTPPAYPTDPGDASGEVSFLGSGERVANTGAPLLVQAEAAGLAPEHGCRMGICHTCTAIRVSGTTRDVRTGELGSEPGERIRICVSAPVGDVAVDL